MREKNGEVRSNAAGINMVATSKRKLSQHCLYVLSVGWWEMSMIDRI